MRATPRGAGATKLHLLAESYSPSEPDTTSLVSLLALRQTESLGWDFELSLGSVINPNPTDSRALPRLAGYVAVAVAAALWAIGAVLARQLFDAGTRPVELAESRAVLAGLGIALLRPAWRPPTSARRGLVLALGLTFALVNLTYYLAVASIPVAAALVIQYTAPALIVTYTSIVSRRRPSGAVLASLVAAVLGVVLVANLGAGAFGVMDGLGVAMALTSAALFALYTILAGEAVAVYGAAGAMCRTFMVASLFWILYQAPRGVPTTILDRSSLPKLLYIGLGGTLLPFLLYVWGVGHVRAERAAIVATLEPVFGALLAWVWLRQGLSVHQMAGGLLVLAAVAWLAGDDRYVLVTGT